MVDGSAAEYSSSAASVEVESRKKKKINKKRFSDDQIGSLELIFESDTKLESMKKVEVAKELGLQPRQVAIWFQNKRARWKSKQLEKDYTVLLANHNCLASQFESLKKQNHSLLMQLQKMKKQIELETAGREMSGADGELDDAKIDSNVIPTEGGMFADDDESSTKAEEMSVQPDEENDRLLKMVESAAAVESTLTSSDQDWGTSCLNSDDLINQPSESYPWWDFWC